MKKTAVSSKKPSFDLSPSLHHQRVTSQTAQALSYKGEDFKTWQRKLRRKLAALLGPIPQKRVPLNVRSLWRRETDLGSIEKIVFTAEPGADVPAYVCLPKGAQPPYKFFICLQGHSTGMHNSIAVDQADETKPIEVPGDRDFALGCMRRGVAALCIEQRSLGERREQTQGFRCENAVCHDAAMQAILLGRTLIGERVFDVDRAIDYLASRGDVDMKHVGVMGNSGGGTTSLFAAAMLPRLALAMPSCYFCTFRDSILSIYHCMCNYVPGLYAWAEMADVMGLFAPRPLVIVAGKEDTIFPISGVQKAFRQLKRIYRAAGAEKNCRLVVGPEGHRFYADLAWAKMLPELRR